VARIDLSSGRTRPASRRIEKLLDDSCPTPMMVRSTDLPPVGKAFSVVGVVLPDPVSGAPILKEVSRSSARR